MNSFKLSPFWSQNSLHLRAFSLIELLVVVMIMGLLCGLLIPALARIRQVAASTQCQSNLRQLSMADEMYATENNGAYVPIINGGASASTCWQGNSQFRSYLNLPSYQPSATYADYAPAKMICPKATLAFANPGPGGGNYPLVRSYGYNVTGLSYNQSTVQIRRTQITNSSRRIRMADSCDLWIDYANWQNYNGEVRPPTMCPAYRHGNAVNVVFFDGHCEAIAYAAMAASSSLWNLNSGQNP